MDYNYLDEIKKDILYVSSDYNIPKGMDDDEKYDYLYDDLLIDDGVTGNGSGSYTFSSYEASKNLVGNFDLAQEALETFGYDSLPIEKLQPEYLDVTIRCYLLGQALKELIDDGKI